jgi:hypothetical protein
VMGMGGFSKQATEWWEQLALGNQADRQGNLEEVKSKKGGSSWTACLIKDYIASSANALERKQKWPDCPKADQHCSNCPESKHDEKLEWFFFLT